MLVFQSCLTLYNPLGCCPPGSSVIGILQARILEWVAIPFSRGSSQPRDWTLVSCIASRRFTIWATSEALIWNVPPHHSLAPGKQQGGNTAPPINRKLDSRFIWPCPSEQEQVSLSVSLSHQEAFISLLSFSKSSYGSEGKQSACNAGYRVQSLGWDDPLEKEMATHSSHLA